MIKNYLAETDLEGVFPELDKYLWNGETDWSKQKTKAEQIVINDFMSRGYKGYLLRTPLSLRTTGAATLPETGDKSDEDDATRIRLVYNIASLTTPVTLTLQGTNDSSSETYSTITTVALTTPTTGESSTVFGQVYKYYRINAAGTGTPAINYTADLVDTMADSFFLYKWLELIMLNNIVEKDDQFDIKRQYCADRYNELWNTAQIFEDKDESGDLEESEGTTSNDVTFTL